MREDPHNITELLACLDYAESIRHVDMVINSLLIAAAFVAVLAAWLWI